MSRKTSGDYSKAISERSRRLGVLADRIARATEDGEADPRRLQAIADDFSENMACLGYDVMRWAMGEGLEVPSAVAAIARHARRPPAGGQGQAAPIRR